MNSPFFNCVLQCVGLAVASDFRQWRKVGEPRIIHRTSPARVAQPIGSSILGQEWLVAFTAQLLGTVIGLFGGRALRFFRWLSSQWDLMPMEYVVDGPIRPADLSGDILDKHPLLVQSANSRLFFRRCSGHLHSPFFFSHLDSGPACFLAAPMS
jgi:hypothetical protein